MQNRNILISGAGIAGVTLAYWLKRFGFNPTVVEISPVLRKGGYIIDFWGAGFDVAEKMGILTALEEVDIKIPEISFVDSHSNRRGGLNALQIRRLLKNRAFTLLRSDLARVIYDHLDKNIEFIWGDAIDSIRQTAEEVQTSFRSGKMRSFDLLIGADGLHSTIRELAFGKEALYEKYYGYYAASFTFENDAPEDKTFQTYNVPCKQAAVYAIKENKSAAFFIFTSRRKLAIEYHHPEKQKAVLRSEFQNIGWKCRELLAKMDVAPDFYFDVVSQIEMNDWSNDRVTLVGDACDCPSLLSGQGSTLAMAGAYILAGELKDANGKYKEAFMRYEQLFKPFIISKQSTAKTFAKSFVPKSKSGIWMRNTFINLMFLPYFSKLFVKRFMYDSLKLKDY